MEGKIIGDMIVMTNLPLVHAFHTSTSKKTFLLEHSPGYTKEIIVSKK